MLTLKKKYYFLSKKVSLKRKKQNGEKQCFCVFLEASPFPFFRISDFLYCLIFQIKPVGESLFSMEKRPCKYSCPKESRGHN